MVLYKNDTRLKIENTINVEVIGRELFRSLQNFIFE